MLTFCLRARRFLRCEEGPTAAEYAIMLAAILGALIAIIAALGGSTSSWWASNSSQIINASDAASGGS